MGALTQGVRTILAVTRFLAMVYMTHLFMYLAPTHSLRHWGATTSWLLIIQFGMAWPEEVIRIDGMADEVRDHPLVPRQLVPGRWRLSTPAQAE